MLEANLLGQLDSLVVVPRTLPPVAGGIFDLREAVQYVSACGFRAGLGGEWFEREPCASRFVDLVDVPQQERADVTRTVLQRGTVLEQLAIDPAGSVERIAIERATCGPIHERSPDLDMRAAGVVADLGRDGCRFAEQLLCAITLTEYERELRKEQNNIAAQDRVVCGLAERLFAQRLGFSYVTWILRQAQERSRANRPRRRVRNDRFDLAT